VLRRRPRKFGGRRRAERERERESRAKPDLSLIFPAAARPASLLLLLLLLLLLVVVVVVVVVTPPPKRAARPALMRRAAHAVESKAVVRIEVAVSPRPCLGCAVVSSSCASRLSAAASHPGSA
jgi:hypothetical protein